MITDLLSQRCSVRKFQNKPVRDAVLHEILEAGRLSPSGGNEQPWAFGVINQPELIAQIAEIADQQTWIAQAPLLIVLCTTPVADELGGRDIQLRRYPGFAPAITALDSDLYWALNQEEHQTKIAGTQMALVALEHGVGSCWVSLFDVKRLAQVLNLPQDWLPSEILVMGYPALPPRQLPKKDLAEIVFTNRYR